MKNIKQLPLALSGAFLAAILLLLPGCGDWLGNKSCPTCGPVSITGAADADVLYRLDGKPVITKQVLDDFFEIYLQSSQEGMYAAMDPQAKRRAFTQLVDKEVRSKWATENKIDQDPEFKKKYALMCGLVRDQLVLEALVKQIADKIDSSDTAVEAYYKENIGKNPVFDNPPFIKTPEGIRMRIVQFSDEKSAKNFLAKAEKAGADFSALAKAIQKDVRDLGLVTAQTTFPADLQKSLKSAVYSLKGKAKTLQQNATELVSVPGGPYLVVKGAGPRQTATYAEWSEVISAQPDFKEKLANYKKQVQVQTDLPKFVEELKKQYKGEENLKPLEEDEARKKSELEAKFKELQEAQAQQEAPEKGEQPAPATQAVTQQA